MMRRRERVSRLVRSTCIPCGITLMAVWSLMLQEPRKVHGFLHPARQIKSKLHSDSQVPLLSDNGDNYRVFFRHESDVVDDRGHSFQGHIASTNQIDRSNNKKRGQPKLFTPKTRAKAKTNKLKINNEQSSSANGEANAQRVCRIVSLSDGKIPTPRCTRLDEVLDPPHLLRKLFHSVSFDKTQGLQYMENERNRLKKSSEKEERKLVSVVRASLEDAGFQLLTLRDLHLCDALNTGYLLRLSIVPDVSELDCGISKELYPEFYGPDGKPESDRDVLFGGKVLVFWRGYSQEVSHGRLLLPKLDYLQASIVQNAASFIKRKLYAAEQAVLSVLNKGLHSATVTTIQRARSVADRAPNKPLSRALRTSLNAYVNGEVENQLDPFFKLSRYGGSKMRFVGFPNTTDPLDPFIICEEKDECDFNSLDDSMYDCLNHNNLRCSYDARMETSGKRLPPMQLLQRVTISNLVDPFSREGRQNFFSTFFSKSELVEPTYKEVVVIWRQKEDNNERPKRPVWTPPRIVYELADMFDFEGLPDPVDPFVTEKKMPLQIRMFDGVPMANLPAVMPKTKLVFRPADAFVFDLISVVSLGLAVGSQRFDSSKLDFLALVSVSLWIVRLVIRYSNKLARYDLLVKKFLTSKISRRDADALAYLSDEAGAQRAARASLVHTWLLQQEQTALNRSWVLTQGLMGVNDIVPGKQVNVDMNAALKDLESIGLISCNDGKVRVVREQASIIRKIRLAWNTLLIPQQTETWTL